MLCHLCQYPLVWCVHACICLCVCVEAKYNPMGAVHQNSFVTYIGAGYINVTLHYIVSLFTMCYVNFAMLLHCLNAGCVGLGPNCR
jgi:hypothetical protein